MRVRDMMSSPAVTVAPGRSVKDVAALVDRLHISAVPVVDEGGVRGIVSKTDIVRLEQQFELPAHRRVRVRRLRGRRIRRTVTAAEAMTSPVVTVAPTTSAVGAAWLMTEHEVHHLPVVERDHVVGMISRSDLVRAFARTDEQIREEILREVLPSLDVSPNMVGVTVANGEVVLQGTVDDETVARCLPHAVRGVIGVVDVAGALEVRRGDQAAVPASVT